MIGFRTTEEAQQSNSLAKYSTEVVTLKDGSYGLLARNGYDYLSPLGATNIRLHLPDRWLDNDISAAELMDNASKGRPYWVPMIYTLGYRNLSKAAFDKIVRAIDPDILIDARQSPYGRVPAFHQNAIRARFPSLYDWRGTELGGSPRRGIPPTTTKAGLERLVDDAQSAVLALFCACETPRGCHRHELIAKAIMRRAHVVHLMFFQHEGKRQLGQFTANAFEDYLRREREDASATIDWDVFP